jgi:hypothetical protein
MHLFDQYHGFSHVERGIGCLSGAEMLSMMSTSLGRENFRLWPGSDISHITQ